MNIPESPSMKMRTVQLLTREGDRIARGHQGRLYSRLLKALRTANPGCFESDDEAGAYLQRYVWPPSQPRLGRDVFPHLPHFPASMKVAGLDLQLLVTNPSRLAAEVQARIAWNDSHQET